MSTVEASEREVNDVLYRSLQRRPRCCVLQRAQVFPRELDLIVFLKDSRKLVSIEIKRGRWQLLLRQAERTQLYCHYSISLLPASMRGRVPVEEFAERGIGLGFFKMTRNGIRWDLEVPPRQSSDVNRGLKRQVYGLFTRSFGEATYGGR